MRIPVRLQAFFYYTKEHEEFTKVHEDSRKYEPLLIPFPVFCIIFALKKRLTINLPAYMNTCPNCQSDVEVDHDLCWNCQYSFSENRIVPDTEFPQVCPHCKTEADASFAFCPNCHQPLGLNNAASDASGNSGNLLIDCLRCKVPMFFKGNSTFRERTGTGISGNLVEFLSNRGSFDVYFCPQCCKIEFFLPPDPKPE